MPQPDDDRRSTALHEAGHVVAHFRLGIDQARATIVADDEHGNAGAVTAEDTPWSRSEAEHQVISLCAGYAALVAAGYTKVQAKAGCGSDFAKAEDIIEFWQLGNLTDWLIKAVKFMRRRKNVRAVELIADHLLEHGTLDFDYMDFLRDVADGNATEADFHQFLAIRRQISIQR